MKRIFLIPVIFASNLVLGQNPSITPQVINAAGDHRQVGTTGVFITDNVGEPFTETLNNNGAMITQGFIQPEVTSIGGFSATVMVQNTSCLDKKDGEIRIKITKAPQAVSYAVTYSWTPTSTCTANCDSLTDLVAQTYSVSMLITYTNAVGTVKNDTLKEVIVVGNGADLCQVKIFSGVSLNSDGKNDVFTIENIEEFPKNRLLIYNRWGNQLADISNYNNITNSWPPKDKLEKLPASTYFYILDLGNGTKPIKGWFELIKNE